MKSTLVAIAALSILTCGARAAGPVFPKVSDNQRFLVTPAGKPFFYLADTAWELFHRLDREEADHYLTTRAKQGFTVIQTVALAEMNGLNVPNAYGHKPLVDLDPSKPDVRDGPENDYWDHVDHIVRRANELGMVIGFLPTWGDKWNLKWGAGPVVFNAENAKAYGKWLGRRYTGDSVIWILGGDRAVESDDHARIIRSMAEGLAEGDGGRHLMTFHPTGGQGSAEHFHGDRWLDFNMRQNGHSLDFTERYHRTVIDYRLAPTKPVIDAEPAYEDIPENFAGPKRGFAIAADIRRTFYWNVFSGAFGHAYGHNAVWQMAAPGRPANHSPLMDWRSALEQPGAVQMKHGKDLMLSRPFLTRIPDDSMLVEGASPHAVPGAGSKRFVATRCAEGSYAMVYVPCGRSFSVNLSKLSGEKVVAWWFDPRTGSAERIGEMLRSGERKFDPPSPGELLDWVLVLDDAAKGFSVPGAGIE